MSVTISVELTEQDAQQLEALAQQEGFQTLAEYVRARILALTSEDVDERNLRESVKQGLREALRGEFVPLDQVWEADDE